jgi:hypothetical protein
MTSRRTSCDGRTTSGLEVKDEAEVVEVEEAEVIKVEEAEVVEVEEAEVVEVEEEGVVEVEDEAEVVEVEEAEVVEVEEAEVVEVKEEAEVVEVAEAVLASFGSCVVDNTSPTACFDSVWTATFSCVKVSVTASDIPAGSLEFTDGSVSVSMVEFRVAVAFCAVATASFVASFATVETVCSVTDTFSALVEPFSNAAPSSAVVALSVVAAPALSAVAPSDFVVAAAFCTAAPSATAFSVVVALSDIATASVVAVGAVTVAPVLDAVITLAAAVKVSIKLFSSFISLVTIVVVMVVGLVGIPAVNGSSVVVGTAVDNTICVAGKGVDTITSVAVGLLVAELPVFDDNSVVVNGPVIKKL